MQKEYSYGVIPIKRIKSEVLFLLVKHFNGHWDFPKGRRNEGESDPLVTARRELEEEGSVNTCRIFPDVWYEDRYVTPSNGVELDKTVRYFLGIVEEEAFPHDDPDGGITERAWLGYAQALERLTYTSKKEILVKAHGYIIGNLTLFH